MRLRSLITIATSMLCASAGIVFLFSRAQRHGSNPSPQFTPVALNSVPSTFRFAGRATYTFRYDSEGTLSLREREDATPAVQRASARVAGTMILDSDGQSRAEIEIHGLTGEAAASEKSAPLPDAPLLTRATFLPDGSVDALEFSPRSPAWIDNMVRSILSVWRIRQSACALKSECAVWSQSEPLPFGTAGVSYSVNAVSRGAIAALPESQTQAHYLLNRTLHAGPPFPLEGTITQSAALVRLNADRPPAFVPYNLEAHITSENHPSPLAEGKSQTTIRMDLVSYSSSFGSMEPSPSSPRSQTAQDPEAHTLAGLSGAKSERDFLEKTLSGASVETVLDELSSLRTRHRGRAIPATESTNTYLRLKALVLLHPETLPALEAELHRVGPSDNGWEIMMGALAGAGTTEAQDLLVEMARSYTESSVTTKIVLLLASSEAPIGLSGRMLLEDLSSSPQSPGELRRVADLALGIAARHEQNGDTNWSDTKVNQIAKQLEKATSRADQLHWLAVAGNAGAPALEGAIVAHLDNRNPQVRAQAVYSLRFLTPQSAQAAINRALNDPAPEVRGKATEALLAQGPNRAAAESLAQRFRSETDPSVRLKLVSALWQMRFQSPLAEEEVRSAAERDVAQSVRNLAQSLVGGRVAP